MEISAKAGELPAVTVNYDLPDTLAGMVEKFGEDAVRKSAEDSIVIAVQAAMRRLMVPKTAKDGTVTPAKSQEEIQAYVDNWKPDGRQVVRQSAVEKATAAVKSMTPEQRAELLKQLQALPA